MVLLQGPTGWRFPISEVPLYSTFHGEPLNPRPYNGKWELTRHSNTFHERTADALS